MCCDGATRQHWGSSALKGGQAYIEATNDAIKNVAAIFCRTGRANLKPDSDNASQIERRSSVSSSRMSPLAMRMMRGSSSQQELKVPSEISPPQSDSTESVSSREEKPSSGYSCLLVDDDKINTRSLIHVLKNPKPRNPKP